MIKNKATSDEKKTSRGKGRFNFIDVLIILAILLLAAIVVNLFLPGSLLKPSSVEKELQYTVEFIGVDEAFIDKINENDVVYDSIAKYNVGTVIAVDKSTPYSVLQYDHDSASAKLATYDGKYNVLVTINVKAEYHENEGYSIGDRRIAVGEKLALRFPDYASEGYCVNLSVAE